MVQQVKQLEEEGVAEAARLVLIEQYTKVLQRRITNKQLQLVSARHLHSVLMSSQGHFIKHHKVIAILNRYQQQHDRLDRLYGNSDKEEEEDDEDEDDKEDEDIEAEGIEDEQEEIEKE